MVFPRLPARLLGFLLGAGVTGLLAGGDSYLLFRGQDAVHRRDAQAILQYQADLLVERLDRRLETWRDLLLAVGALDMLRGEAGSEEALRTALQEVAGANADLLWLGLLDNDGTVISASDVFDALPTSADLAAQIRASGRPAYAGLRRVAGGLVVDIAVPLTSMRLLAAQMSLDWAENLRASQQAHSLDGATITLHGKNGELLLPREAPVLQGAVLTASGTLPGRRYTVRASLEESAVRAPLRPFAWRLGIGSLVISLAVGGLGALLAHQAQRAMAESRAKAERDPLTGLRNRAGLAVWEAAAQGQRVAVVALDLDGFKPINDTHGHAVGDEVLRGVANAMQARLRPGDAAVRLGGDEFLFALLPRTGEDAAASAEAVAWRLIRVLGEGIETSVGQVPVGASAGVALIPEDATSFSAARALADEALYAAKRAGKRTVLRASPAAAPGA